MKNLFLYCGLACILIMAVTSCEKPESEVLSPKLNIPESISVSYEGGESEISYTIENPIEGMAIEAECEAEWIDHVNVGTSEKILFTVAVNDEENTRTAVMVVTYGDIVREVSVIQAASETEKPSEDAFEVEVTDVGYTQIQWNVTPSDDGMRYMSMTVDKRVFDYLGSDEAYFQEDMAIFETMAGYYGMTLSEYLSQITYVGPMPFMDDGLVPGYAYYVYAYGISLEGEMLTSIYKQEFTTLAPEDVDVDFTIVCEPGVNTVDISVAPTDDNQMYMIWYYAEDDIQSSLEETFNMDFEDMLSEKMSSDNVSRSEAVESLASRGEVTKTFDGLKGDTEYTAFAIAVNEEGLFVSDPVTENFKTGTITSDNVITVEVTEVGADWASYSVSTVNDDPYVLYCIEAARWEDWEDKDIIDRLLDTYSAEKYYLYRGDHDSTIMNLRTKTEYVIYTFGCESGTATTSLGKTFFTPTVGESSLDIKLEYGKYFDGNEVLEAYPELEAEHSDFAGQVVFPVRASVSDPSATFLYYVYSSDYSDYDDDVLYSSLSGGTGISEPSYVFTRLYGRNLTVAGFAIAEDGSYGPLYRDTVYFTADDVSPASEFPIELFR